MTRNHHVDAGGIGDEVRDLTLFIICVSTAFAGMAGNNHDVALFIFPQDLLPVVCPFIGVALVLVVRMTEAHTFIMAGQVPVGNIHILKAQDTDSEGLFPDRKFPDDVRCVGICNFFSLRIQQVGAHHRNRRSTKAFICAGQQAVKLVLDIQRKVEFVVAGNKRIVAAIPEAEGRRAVLSVFNIDVIAHDGGTLQQIAVVDQNGSVHFRTLLLHHSSNFQIAVLPCTTDGILVIDFPVHICGGVNTDLNGLRIRCQHSRGKKADYHDYRHNQTEQFGFPILHSFL